MNFHLLKEDGGKLLQENGAAILLVPAVAVSNLLAAAASLSGVATVELEHMVTLPTGAGLRHFPYGILPRTFRYRAEGGVAYSGEASVDVYNDVLSEEELLLLLEIGAI